MPITLRGPRGGVKIVLNADVSSGLTKRGVAVEAETVEKGVNALIARINLILYLEKLLSISDLCFHYNCDAIDYHQPPKIRKRAILDNPLLSKYNHS